MKRTNKRTNKQPVYMLLYNWCDDWQSTACEKFTFHARDDKDADNKAFGWARYHSIDARNVKARLATEQEINRDPCWRHDDWVD